MPSTLVISARRTLARALDDLGVAPVTASSASTFASDGLVNGLPGADVTTLDGRWAYVAYTTLPLQAGAGQQRRVRPGSYVPSTGAATVDPAWTAPVVGLEIELTGLFPCSTFGDDSSYLWMLSSAADRILADDHLTVAVVAQQQEYLLGAYPWCDRPERIVDVKDPPRAAGHPYRPTWRRWEPKLDNGFCWISFLDAAYPRAGTSFQVRVRRPVSSLVNGVESTTGPLLDTDAVMVPLQDWVDVALIYAYQSLATRARGRPDGGVWLARWKDQLAHVERTVRGYDGAAPRPETAVAA